MKFAIQFQLTILIEAGDPFWTGQLNGRSSRSLRPAEVSIEHGGAEICLCNEFHHQIDYRNFIDIPITNF